MKGRNCVLFALSMLPKYFDKVSLVSTIILIAFLLGTFYPDTFWTTHFISFLPKALQLGFITVSIIMIFFPIELRNPPKLNSITIIGAITLISGIVFYQFPLTFDFYGDAYKFKEFLDNIPSKIPNQASDALFSFKLGTSAGQDSVLAIVTYIAYYGQTTYLEAFKLLDAISGALYVFIWLSFSKEYYKNHSTRFIFALIIFSSPLIIIFLGHQEIYSISFALFSFWITSLIKFFSNKTNKRLVTLIISWLICLKLHSVAILLFPALILSILAYINKLQTFKTEIFSFKKLIYFILLPSILLGLIGYFFIFKDFNDPRNLNEQIIGSDRLFLPIISPEPPLDNYNLFSFHHLFDFFILPFIWSPIVVLIVFSAGRKKLIELIKTSLIARITLITLTLFLFLFFAINPLLSMPIDWDLFSFPALLLFGLVSILLKEMEKNEMLLIERLKKGSLAIVFISTPFFIVHFSNNMLSKRFESLGKHIYFSYYEWSAKVIEYGLGQDENPESIINRRENLIASLKPFAIKNKDREFTSLLIKQANHYIENNQPKKALIYLNEAEIYYPQNKLIPLYKMESYFFLKEYKLALEEANYLVDINYPSEQKALSIAIHCAIESRKYDEALKYCNTYLEKWKDSVIEEVKNRIESKSNLEQLSNLFN